MGVSSPGARVQSVELTTWIAGSVLACTLAGCTGSGDRARASRDASKPDEAGTSAEGCHPPAGATALCLTFKPESITPEAEPGLDERGFLNVEVFDRPNTPLGAMAASIALVDRTLPGGADAGVEIALTDLPQAMIVLEDPPPTVFVRTLFFDSGGFGPTGGFNWGTWVGGFDLSRGLTEDITLVPIPLTAGDVTMVDVPLRALRRLTATVTTSAKPLGDGEGALSVVASPVAALSPNAPTYGYGIDPCVDVTRGPQTVGMILLGSGKFYVTGYFDDLGIKTPGQVPPGTLLSVRYGDPSMGQATYDAVTVGEEQYSAAISIDLDFVTAFSGDPSAIGPNSCKDLGFPGTP